MYRNGGGSYSSSLDSQWVKKEYHYALALKHPIIPIELETVPPIMALNTIQRAYFQTDYQAGLRTVLVALSQIGHEPIQRNTTATPGDTSPRSKRRLFCE